MPDTSALIGVEARFKALPVEDCFESPTNPRTHRNPSKYAELLASVKAGGVHTPVISRPAPMPSNGKKKVVPGWEVIAGSGRLRAAKEAGRAEIPSMVADYTDQQVLEIQLIENLIREDPHPLQEAEGFSRLLGLPGYSIDLVTERTGAKREYISKRLSLCNLIQPAKDSFMADAINIGHATRLARLPEPQQKFAFNELLFTQDRAWNSKANRHDVSDYAITVQEFDRAIRSNILLDLGAVPWDKTDAGLMPEAGACTTCLKHTQAQADLFDDHAKGDLCLDRVCFQAKKAAVLIQIQTDASDAGETLILISESWNTDYKGALNKSQYTDLTREKPAKCPSSEKALIVEGERAGMLIKICKAHDCKLHRARYSVGGNSSSPKKDYWADRAKALEKKINWETRITQVAAICESPLKWTVPHAALQVIARSMLGHGVPVELLRCLGVTDKVKGTSEAHNCVKRMIAAPAGGVPATAALQQVVVALSLQEFVKEYYFGGSDSSLTDALKAFKIDGKKIATKVAGKLRADFNAKRAKAKAKAASLAKRKAVK